jgi:hypothetical protein
VLCSPLKVRSELRCRSSFGRSSYGSKLHRRGLQLWWLGPLSRYCYLQPRLPFVHPTQCAVGAITLIGAAVGLFATEVQSWPSGALWRLPAAALAVAGVLVVWASGTKRLAP